MSESIYKYYIKIFSIVLVIGFSNMSAGLCALVVLSCEPEEISCCCKGSESTSSHPVNLENECCCVIKEMTSQPAEINLSLNESIQKNLFHISSIYSALVFTNLDFNSGDHRVLSSHSPPKEKIHILNSNFRI